MRCAATHRALLYCRVDRRAQDTGQERRRCPADRDDTDQGEPIKRVLVVDPEPADYLARLEARFPELSAVGAPTFGEAERDLAQTQILLTRGTAIDAVALLPEHVRRMPELEWIQCLISGSEHVQRALEGRGDVLVTTAKGIHGPQMSEMAIFFMLMLAREGPRILRNQAAARWERIPQRVLERKTVGIIGLGSIGGHLARLCKAFEMTVYGMSRSGRSVLGVDRVYRPADLMQLAAEVDFLVLTVPATADTLHLIDSRVLAAMKSSAYLINLARGQVVDEAALIEALRGGSIAGAGLDVFEQEPLPPTSPLWAMENVVITPHIGGGSDLYLDAVLEIVEHNIERYLAGFRDDMINVVPAAA